MWEVKRYDDKSLLAEIRFHVRKRSMRPKELFPPPRVSKRRSHIELRIRHGRSIFFFFLAREYRYPLAQMIDIEAGQ